MEGDEEDFLFDDDRGFNVWLPIVVVLVPTAMVVGVGFLVRAILQ